jgi:glycosyltransferase involved in cell wall biosynthesis
MTEDTIAPPRDRSPRRLVLVLPTTGEFDSRTYRIASSAASRGHRVTVLARWAPGLPRDMEDPAGYRIVRVPVSAIDGLPLPSAIRALLARWWTGRRGTRPAAGMDESPTEVGGQARHGAIGRLRLAFHGLARTAAITLTVRSQRAASRRVDPGADVYHAMAYMGIPVGLALRVRHGGCVVYDARDIYVDANNLARLPALVRRALGAVERRWARAADLVVTVNRPYAEVMAARWGVPMPVIVMNCSFRPISDPDHQRRFHERLGLDPATRVVLYHGGLAPNRGIEQLIEAMPSIPDATLVLLGYGPLAESLRRRAAAPAAEGRIRVLSGVPPRDLVDWVAAADVVAMPIQPSTLNHRLTTPNKLFEALAAGVPVVASDLPGMAGIVHETEAGRLVDPTDPVAIAAAVRSILDAPLEEREAMRSRALAAARDRFTWEAQAEILFAAYGRLTGEAW